VNDGIIISGLMLGRVEPSFLKSLQSQTEIIRNVCILAHVDHGKTTLSDSLVSSNGIISQKLAGKLRFLDSTAEEQERGITMSSSAISLYFKLEQQEKQVDYLINLIDSPGHIDFSSEVSTATRLCDGALLVVDVIEGVCSQTHAVLYKALKERIVPVLVLNKIDRLVLELQLTPKEAFHHIRRVVEKVNSLASVLVKSEQTIQMEAAEEKRTSPSKSSIDGLVGDSFIDDEEDEVELCAEDWSFEPSKGNVVFTSAMDCWGFGIAKFANLWAKKLGVRREILARYFFEDYWFNSKTNTILKCDNLHGAPMPMFASMILEPLWQIYNTTLVLSDPGKAVRMAARALEVEIPAREVNTRDPRLTLQAILRRWIPLSDAVLRAVVRVVPSPKTAQVQRASVFLSAMAPFLPFCSSSSPSSASSHGPDRAGAEAGAGAGAGTGTGGSLDPPALVPAEIQARSESCARSRASVRRCDSGSKSPLFVYVSKMVPVRFQELSRADREAVLARTGLSWDRAPDTVMMGLARVFSGVLRSDKGYFLLSHRYNPFTAAPTTERTVDFAGTNADAACPPRAQDTQGSPFGYSETPLSDSCLGDGHVEQLLTTRLSTGQAGGQTHVLGGAMSASTSIPPGTLSLYLCQGPSITTVDEVPAGNIVGIVGLDSYMERTGNLTDSLSCLPFRELTFQSQPLVSVAVEPESHTDLQNFETGLRALYQLDPVVEISVDRKGQWIVSCLGELHLEQCIKALASRVGVDCKLKVSPPLVAFRETILHCPESRSHPRLPPPWGDLLSDHPSCTSERCRMATNCGRISLTIRAVPLPLAAQRALGAASAHTAVAKVAAALDASSSGVSKPLPTDPLARGLLEALLAALAGVRVDNAENGDHAKNAADQGAVTWDGGQIGGFSGSDREETSGDSARRLVELLMGSLYARKRADYLKKCASEGGLGKDSEEIVKALDESEVATLYRRLVALNSNTNLMILSSRLQLDIWSDKVPLGEDTLQTPTAQQQPSSLKTTIQLPWDSPVGVTPSGIPAEARECVFFKAFARLQSSLTAAFQIACDNGPLMHESLFGVAFLIEKIEISQEAFGLSEEDVASVSVAPNSHNKEDDGTVFDLKGRLRLSEQEGICSTTNKRSPTPDSKVSSGVSSKKSLFAGGLVPDLTGLLQRSLLVCPLRVVEQVYKCDIQCDSLQLGSLYAVLSKRRGVVIEEDVVEGTTLFLLGAQLPVAESFGFASELLEKTSGVATAPQMKFSHWRTQQDDPFWRPTTVEEREDYGEVASGAGSRSRVLIDSVRERKGLPVAKKTVNFAEKQRTLNKKK
jgi:small GTP-binding protein